MKIIKLKLTGELRHIFKKSEIALEFNKDDELVCLRSILARLIRSDGAGENVSRIILNSNNIDAENIAMKDLNPAIIILINDVDYRVIDGLESMLKNGDNVTIIPSIHGG
ncbi:MAG: hypothetical protein ACFFCS_09995 [Candidatus Hodarchaeota archaeon]